MNSYNGFTPKQRQKAYNWFKNEYVEERRHPPTTCDVCGQPAGIFMAHSEDYSEPYGDHIGAYGLCYPCHMIIHCRFKAPMAWKFYRDKIGAGFIIDPPYTSNNWPRFRAQILSAYPIVGWKGCDNSDKLLLEDIVKEKTAKGKYWGGRHA